MQKTMLAFKGALVFGLMISVATIAFASEMTYEPVNPNFGGSPFNGAYLLGNAEAQNDNVKPTKANDPLENFERSVTSSLLSRISSEIADRILGEDAQDSGTFRVGDTELNFHREGENVIINIIDTVGGQQTTVEVPAPVF